MAALNELIDQIQDVTLRNRILQEVSKLQKQKKFGLIYEDHIPEATLLYDMPIKKGVKVVLRSGEISDCYRVCKIEGDNAICVKLDDSKELVTLPKSDLVAVAHFGEAIYPYLKYKDSICNAPDSYLWHTLIEADNYHALQLLVYLYAGQVSCIYIDPPYNTGAKDWKYNNDYVDSKDAYRHSKWLSMMEKRLKLAKKLLNPKESVLIVTIDEKEYHHLACLLEQMFPEAQIQMITSVISGKGVSREGQFSRVEEYIFIVTFGTMQVVQQYTNMLNDEPDDEEEKMEEIEFLGLRRRNKSNFRASRPNQFYPFFVDENDGHIVEIGKVLPHDVDRHSITPPVGCVAIYPLDPKGNETIWGLVPESAQRLLDLGCLKMGNWDNKKKYGTIKYLASGTVNKILDGSIQIKERDKYGAIVSAVYANATDKTVRPRKVWNMKTHNASVFGTLLLKQFLADKRFSFPKSLYAVADTLRFFVADKPNALILDFFAGSGTTLHAVNLLNAEDGGARRCIMVTNNEVSEAEATELTEKGFKQGDEEWEKLGIANYVTWQRTKSSIIGRDVNGKQIKGKYLGSEIPISDGFQANAIFFKLGFLDKTSVSLGRQLKELISVLWMKAGAKGECPTISGDEDMIILPANKFALLVNESEYSKFEEELNKHPEIEVVYIVTNSEAGYREMIANLNVKDTYQLYRDYLDNFSINYSK